MSLEKASIVWSAKQLSGMIKNDKIDFNHIIQRSYVWERTRKTGLIESMIIGYPIPPVFAKRMDDGTGKRGGNIYYIMDGKQRLSTVKEYLNDEFALTNIPPVNYFDEEKDEECAVDISGMKFSELPDALKDHLNTATFNVTYFDNLTKEEEKELFKRLNAGKPLSAKSRTLASAKNIESLLDIGSHKLFEEMLTEKARANKNQVTIVMKAWAMLNNEIMSMSFASKDFNPMIEQADISDDERTELVQVFDFIVNVHDELINNKEKSVAKKLYTETHFVSLVPYIRKAMKKGISEAMMAEWMINFFKTENNTDVYDEYMSACKDGVARNVNIVTRHEALEKSYEEFFKEENSENILTTM